MRMGVVRWCFAVFVCLAIGIASYLPAGALATDIDSAGVVFRPPVAHGIFAQPPFDLLRGNTTAATQALREDPERDWYQLSTCDRTTVSLIATYSRPVWSFAAITSADGQTRLRRTGDPVGGRSVAFIVHDRVWLGGRGDTYCQVRLADKPSPVGPAPAALQRARPDDRISALLAKIHRIGPREFNVERAAVDRILERQAELLKGVGVHYDPQQDRRLGVVVSGVGAGSLLAALGLENGDHITSINGFDVTDPKQAIEAYSKVRHVSDVVVALRRRGQPATLDVHVR